MRHFEISRKYYAPTKPYLPKTRQVNGWPDAKKRGKRMRWILCLLAFYLLNVPLSSSVKAGEINILKTTLDGPATEEFGMGCSLGCAVGWDITASSTRKPQGKIKYGIEKSPMAT